MKVSQLFIGLVLVATVFTQCKKDSFMEDVPVLKKGEKHDSGKKGEYIVTVENVSTPHDFFAAGAVFIPDGKGSAGPAFPGESFTVSFHAGRNHRLSFATMYGASNDHFYAPNGDGIALFSGDTPLTGEITSFISLWDAGTEENHMPGSGEDGAPESVVIKSVRNTDNVMDGYNYNTVEGNLMAELAYDGTSMFTLTIHVLPGSTTPLSPVAWVVHSASQYPIFKEGSLDYGSGLEALAETGNAGPLSDNLKMKSGYVSPVAPVLWVLHDKNDHPLFAEGAPDYGMGLETLAETGNPGVLYNSLMAAGYETGVYLTRDDGSGDGPLFPGQKYVFSIPGGEGKYLSIASMLGASNDEFFSTGDDGIRLWDDKGEKNITNFIELYDAGTEVNEYPGAGFYQGGPEGSDEMGNVGLLNDEFMWPEASQVIKVTIRKEKDKDSHDNHGHHDNDDNHGHHNNHGKNNNNKNQGGRH